MKKGAIGESQLFAKEQKNSWLQLQQYKDKWTNKEISRKRTRNFATGRNWVCAAKREPKKNKSIQLVKKVMQQKIKFQTVCSRTKSKKVTLDRRNKSRRHAWRKQASQTSKKGRSAVNIVHKHFLHIELEENASKANQDKEKANALRKSSQIISFLPVRWKKLCRPSKRQKEEEKQKAEDLNQNGRVGVYWRRTKRKRQTKSQTWTADSGSNENWTFEMYFTQCSPNTCPSKIFD